MQYQGVFQIQCLGVWVEIVVSEYGYVVVDEQFFEVVVVVGVFLQVQCQLVVGQMFVVYVCKVVQVVFVEIGQYVDGVEWLVWWDVEVVGDFVVDYDFYCVVVLQQLVDGGVYWLWQVEVWCEQYYLFVCVGEQCQQGVVESVVGVVEVGQWCYCYGVFVG